MKIGDWTMIAFFFSTTLVLVLGTLIEQFKLRHWSLSYLAILSIISSFVSFFLLLVSMLDRFPFVIIGWIVFALPPVINFCYNLFNLVRAPKNVPLA